MKKSFSINVLTSRTTVFAGVVVAAAAVALSGCSKTEAPKSKGAVPMVGQNPQENEPSAPRKIVDYMAGLKNIKDESKSVTKEEMVRSSQQVVASAESAKAAAKPPEPAKPAPEPVKTAPTTVAAAPPPAPAASQIPPSKTAPGDNVVAKAAPSSAPAPAATSIATPVTREAPDFPREAIRSGVDSGAVRARLSIDAAGNVTNVQIVEARPARVFDRSVRDTLSRWKFNAGSEGRSYDTEVEFKR
jgi:TonB family protein